MLSRRLLLARGLGTAAGIVAAPALLNAQTTGPATAPGPATGPTTTQAAPKPIPTATGSILPSEMGLTSAHEHVSVHTFDNPQARKENIDFAVAELNKAKTLGLKTIVNPGPFDDPAGLREVSEATGVNIVCCTGYYQLIPAQMAMRMEEFEAKMLRDFEQGLGDTGIRPGVIKVATRGLPIKPAELNVLIAAARVHRKYDVPLCIHSTSGCYDQQVILESAGANLKRCYFSHTEAQFGWQKRSVEKEIDYLQQVVAKGSVLCFNNFGNWAHTKPANMALILKELVRRGYDGQIFATMDTIWERKNGKLIVAWEDINPDGRERTYGYLINKAMPWMIENGVPEASVKKFVTENPQRVFTST